MASVPCLPPVIWSFGDDASRCRRPRLRRQRTAGPRYPRLGALGRVDGHWQSHRCHPREGGHRHSRSGHQRSSAAGRASHSTALRSPLTTHHLSPVTSRQSPLTTLHSPLSTHHSPDITHCPPLTHRPPLTAHCSPPRRASSSRAAPAAWATRTRTASWRVGTAWSSATLGIRRPPSPRCSRSTPAAAARFTVACVTYAAEGSNPRLADARQAWHSHARTLARSPCTGEQVGERGRAREVCQGEAGHRQSLDQQCWHQRRPPPLHLAHDTRVEP